MRKNIIFLYSFLVLFPFCVNAQVPLPDPLALVLEKVQMIGEKGARIEQDVIKPLQKSMKDVQKVVQKGKSKVEQAKELTNKIVGVANGTNKDYLGTALSILSGLDIDKLDLGADFEKEILFSSHITPEQYQLKMKKVQEYERKKVADLYAEAFVRRMEIIDEEVKSQEAEEIDFDSMPMNDLAKAVNMRVSPIVKRFNNMRNFENLTGQFLYYHRLSTYSNDEENDGKNKDK